MAALDRRRDETYKRLETEQEYLQDKDNSIYWHSTCYSTYTSEQNLKYAEVQQGRFKALVNVFIEVSNVLIFLHISVEKHSQHNSFLAHLIEFFSLC